MTIEISEQELATVLAALRFWQEYVDDEGTESISGSSHFAEHRPLGVPEIDNLCERINCGPDEPDPAAEAVWGVETLPRCDYAVRAIEAYCIDYLSDTDCCAVKVGEDTYAIRIIARLEKP